VVAFKRWNQIDYWLDANFEDDSIGRLINHSCPHTANLRVQPVADYRYNYKKPIALLVAKKSIRFDSMQTITIYELGIY